MTVNRWAGGLVLAIFIVTAALTAQAAPRCYQMVDETGAVVYTTGWKARTGDQFLTGDNRRYEIIEIKGDIAKVRLLGIMNLSQYRPPEPGPGKRRSWPAAASAQGKPKVAVYHTHGDESYVPTDGEESIDNGGGIIKVGDAFVRALEAEGIQAIHSDANHSPHDDMAYERSRRTVTQLLKQKPDAVFDIHRDATPPEAYAGVVDGQEVAKLQLVVGKYGPTGKQIEDYALRLKAASDEQHPGLIKGIFFAKGGDYNQDLHPRSILIEAGAHTNNRPAAERGIAMFASVVPAVLGKTGANTGDPNGAAGFGTAASGPSGATKSLGWIVGLAVLGGAVFLFLSTGSGREAKAKLKRLTTEEFRDLTGPAKDDDQKDPEK